jgi:hypothetical protein
VLFARPAQVLTSKSRRLESLLYEMVRRSGDAASGDAVIQASTAALSDRIDVSCVLNLHREGDLAVPTLRSIGRLINHSRERSIGTELVVVLDDSDTSTRDVLAQALTAGILPPDSRVVEVTHSNLGSSRMSGVELSKGSYVAFLDGDDLYSINWLTSALRIAKDAPAQSVAVHPEINIYFGEDHRLTWHPDESTYDGLPYGGLLFENCWTSLSLASKALLLDHPIQELALEEGFGFEDWHWNIEAVTHGVMHRVAPRTCHFIRLKGESSLNRKSAAHQVVVRPSGFSAALMWRELPKRPSHGAAL